MLFETVANIYSKLSLKWLVRVYKRVYNSISYSTDIGKLKWLQDA